MASAISISLPLLCLASSALPLLKEESPSQDNQPPKVLIIDGQDLPGHKWKETTPVMVKTLESAGFQVEIATTPPKESPESEWAKFKPKFDDYDSVIMNYYGENWPEDTYSSFKSYVYNGGGLVGVHAGTSPFAERPDFGNMVGVAWRGKNAGKAVYIDDQGKRQEVATGEGSASGHDKNRRFDIRLNTEHPVTAKLSTQWSHLHDELYVNLRGPAENMTVLASAKSNKTNRYEPMVWTVDVGKGRSFMTSLGHSVQSRTEPEFKKLLILGTLWSTGANDKEVITLGEELAYKSPPQALIKKHLVPNALPYDKLAVVKLPITNGVKLHNPASIATKPDGTVFVANYSGAIYTLVDSNKDGLEDTAQLFTDLADLPLPPEPEHVTVKGEKVKSYPYRYPTGMTFHEDWLYVATSQAILRYRDDDQDGKADRHEVYATGWPYTQHIFDWTFGLRFDKDGFLYTILCTDYLNGNKAQDPEGLRGSILKIAPGGQTFERFAYGLRYAYDLTFNEQGDLFFTDNKSGDNPTEELNHAVFGGNYGHQPKDLPSMTSEAQKPILDIKNGYSPCGIEQVPSSALFDGHQGDLFITAWGPDGRWDKGNLIRVKLEKQDDGSYKTTEHLSIDNLPKIVDLAYNSVNNSLYVARFGKEGRGHTPVKAESEGDIYRIIPAWWIEPKEKTGAKNNLLVSLKGDPENGEKIFKQRACVTCHTVDGSDTMIGPDLKYAGWALGREGIVKSVDEPHDNIKTDYDTRQITTKDGQSIMGILRKATDIESTFMLVGNISKTIKNTDITNSTLLPNSLMPPGLFTGLTDEEIDDLVAYLQAQDMPEPVLYINCGGQETKENNWLDTVWLKDQKYQKGSFGYVGGKRTNARKWFPHTTWLHFNYRYAEEGFAYKFDLVPGTYEVTLAFFDFDNYQQSEKRIFSVAAEGNTVLNKYDPEAARMQIKDSKLKEPIGKETFTVTVEDGSLDLEFLPEGTGAPFVSGIGIRRVTQN